MIFGGTKVESLGIIASKTVIIPKTNILVCENILSLDKVVVSICVLDLFPSLTITSFYDSISLIHVLVWNNFQGCNQ
jgi:hypothetical protein